MSYFYVQRPRHHANTAFIDRQTAYLDDGKFGKLATRLEQYWQTGGQEVMSLADGDNQLLSKQSLSQIEQIMQTFADNPPTPDACVLIAISDEDEPRLLFTERDGKLKSHAGEVSFVGGKKDADDVSSWQVATREAFEEVGLSPDDASLIGFLPMQFAKNGLLVRPVVAKINQTAMDKLVANRDEIAKMFWLPLSYLQQNPPSDYVFDRWHNDKQYRLHTPAWVVQTDDGKQVIWGLTGRILANFLQLGYGVDCPWYYRLQA